MTSDARPLLEIRELTVEARDLFGERHLALRQVSLSLGIGEILVLAGERESGKSLLARMIGGPADRRVKVLSGSAVFDGHSLLGGGRRPFSFPRRSEIALVPSPAAAPPVPGLTVKQWLSRLPKIVGKDRRNPIEGFRGAGLHEPEELFDQVLADLPPLVQKRLALFRALRRGVRLLVAEDSEIDLDASSRASWRETLRQLRDESGLAILGSCDSLGGIETFADRVAVIFAGGLLESGPAGTIAANPRYRYTRELRACAPSLTRSTLAEPPISLEAVREAEAAVNQAGSAAAPTG